MPDDPSPRLPDALTRVGPHLIVAVVSLVVLYNAWTGSPGYNTFTDRDLARALLWRTELPVDAAEMSKGSGARVPGIGLFLSMGLPAVLFGSARASFYAMVLQLVGSFWVLHLGLRRELGRWGSAAAAALFASGPALIATTHDLWNPAWLPLPMCLALVALARVVTDRDARWLPAVGFCVAWGAQMHLSAWIWGGGALLAALLARPAGLGRGVAGFVGAVLVAYAPYLLVDALRGFANTSLFFEHAAQEDGPMSRDLLPRLITMITHDPRGSWTGLLSACWWLPVAVSPVVALVALTPVGSRLGRGRSLAGALGLTVLVYAIATNRSDTPNAVIRYMLALEPTLAVLAAMGGVALVRLTGRAGPALAAMLFLALGARSTRVDEQWRRGDPLVLSAVLETVEAVSAHTGWSAVEVAGRAAWVGLDASGEARSWGGGPSLEHHLLLQGERFSGSGAPPCAALFVGDGAQPMDPVWLRRALFAQMDVRPLEVVQLDTPWTLVIYEHDGSHCATSMSQRYIDLPSEVPLRPYHRALSPGVVVRQPFEGGVRLLATMPEVQGQTSDCTRVPIAVDVWREGDVATTTLTSPVLRGLSDNEGWRSSCTIFRPTLLLQRGEESRELVIASDVVGGMHANSPLTRTHELPGGAWQGTLVLEAVTFVDAEFPREIANRVRVQLPAGEL